MWKMKVVLGWVAGLLASLASHSTVREEKVWL